MREPDSQVVDDASLWSTWDEEAPEEEVSRLVADFVAATKPHTVVELGTARGYTCRKIVAQLAMNGRGHLHTYEVDVVKKQEAADRLGEGWKKLVSWHGDAMEPNVFRFGMIDLLFVDAVLERRVDEYLHWRPALRDGGIALLHDTLKFDPPRSQLARIPDPYVSLRTPRGLTIVEKVVIGGDPA